MILKEYQKNTLTILRRYFESCRLKGPAESYREIIDEPTQKIRLGRYAQEYKSLNELQNTPYICLRLPTGGGKTFLAAQSIAIARDSWVEKDYPTVLWLVPTNTIRIQTVEALKNTKHPYRRELDNQFSSRVRVYDIGEFTNIRPQDIRTNLTIVVGTIQTLKVANTEGRRVYAHNEDMAAHFTKKVQKMPGLEALSTGEGVKFSFANLLHVLHPIMIVDEAHNAVTGLTREMQKRVNPSCIIEFSATPRLNSNILHSVTAQEVKNEEMIKLPIVLAEHVNWQSAVDGAIQRRKELAAIAIKDTDYIRPVVLFQAQKKNQEVTVDVLKKYLVETSAIEEKKIAIATGAQRELDEINLFDPDCPIEYVITIEALKEGWDCSFAYIFCSVSRISSAVAVEQLLGRVLRMPYARRRSDPALNRAYAHVSETNFAQAANALRDKLVAMGFDEEEAAINIEQERQEISEFSLGVYQTEQKKEIPTLTEVIEPTPLLDELPVEDQNAVTVKTTETGQIEVTVTGHVTEETIEILSSSVSDEKKDSFKKKAKKFKQQVEKKLSPATRRISFSLPKLMTEIQGEIEIADHEIFDECFDWSLSEFPAILNSDDFNIRDDTHSFEIDIDGRLLAISYASQEEQLSLDVEVEEWTENRLALALDQLLADARIPQAEMLNWCLKHVHHLTNNREITLSALWRAKFVLARTLSRKIADLKTSQAKKAYQKYLFSPDAYPVITFSDSFVFSEGMYDGQKPYRGSFRFRKHYLDFVPEFDGGAQGEEFQCAMALESIPEVKHWLRNISKHAASFRLPLAQAWTYPDFVAELCDGRLLVVEYKGAHLLNDPSTKEKRLIGELWEKQMVNKGLYIMAVKEVDGKDVRTQLIEKIQIQND